MNIHLIIPPTGYIAQRWKEGSTMPPLGILYLAAVLEKAGHRAHVTASEVLHLTPRQILAEVALVDAPMVGLTITTENRFEAFELARMIKNEFPDKKILIGGPHATMAGEDLIRHIGEIDIAVVGEGEETMLELASWWEAGATYAELRKIKGLIIRIDGNPFHTGRRPFIQDLDSLPFPAKHLVPMEKYNFTWTVDGEKIPAANIITSRGCPFNCNFCATPVTWGRKVRGYSPERVIAEARWNMEKFGARYIWFYDDTFNYDPRRTEEICSRILAEKLGIQFVAELRIDALKYDLLAKMREAGCQYISFGVEAGNERVRREIVHKQIGLEKVYQVLDWVEKLGLQSTVFFIFSHPTETWADARETLEIMESIRSRTEIAVSILHIYPGTELETYARAQGILPADFTWTKHDRRVALLPAAQGEVPLFKDQFTWTQIGELIFRWSGQSKKNSPWKKIPEVLRSIRSPSDIPQYAALTAAFLKTRWSKNK